MQAKARCSTLKVWFVLQVCFEGRAKDTLEAVAQTGVSSIAEMDFGLNFARPENETPASIFWKR